MSAFLQLLRPLKPGEQRIHSSKVLPIATKPLVTDQLCHELVEELREHLRTSPWVARIEYGPKILRETISSDGRGELVITAWAIVSVTSEEDYLRSLAKPV